MIGNVIAKLRNDLRLTQEEFADRAGVSVCRVAEWENGTSLPDSSELLTISKRFGVSADCLLENDKDPEKSRTFMRRKLHIWETYERQLDVEFVQCTDEGLDIGAYRDIGSAICNLPDGRYKKAFADTFFDVVANAPGVDGFGYREPSDLDGILAERRQFALPAKTISAERMRDKVKGAWFGRICGCLLGKPIEGIISDQLEKLLEMSGNYPMKRYILSTDITDEICDKVAYYLKGGCWADVVNTAPPDDDTNYTVLSGIIIDRYGFDFTPSDVLDVWMRCQGKDAYCTAERVAWKNYFEGIMPPDTAVYKNPYREWIGAQIRGDYFGYICPGNPQYAAELAWRDACISHIKNGIYGEMFVSAMLACAAVCDNVRDVIYGGLGQIPASSRLYEEIVNVIGCYDSGMSVDGCRKKIKEKYDENTAYGWCHVIPNAMIVVMSLLYGTTYTDVVCMAVETGFDTDCNGATAGSVFGMLRGSSAVGEEWTAPVNNVLRTSVFGRDRLSVDDLIEKTMKHILMNKGVTSVL